MPSVALTPATRPDRSIRGAHPAAIHSAKGLPRVRRDAPAVAALRAGTPSPADGSGPTTGIPDSAVARTGLPPVGPSSVVALIRAVRDSTVPRAWPRGLADPPQARG